MGAKFSGNFLQPAQKQASAQGHNNNKLNLWPAAGCEAKVVADISSRPLHTTHAYGISDRPLQP